MPTQGDFGGVEGGGRGRSCSWTHFQAKLKFQSGSMSTKNGHPALSSLYTSVTASPAFVSPYSVS